MATVFDNVLLSRYSENGTFEESSEQSLRLHLTKRGEVVQLDLYNGMYEICNSLHRFFQCCNHIIYYYNIRPIQAIGFI